MDIVREMEGKMKKIFLIIGSYFPIMVGLLFAKQLGLAQIAVGFFSSITGILILIFAQNVSEFLKLSLHQFIGFLVADGLAGLIYLYYQSDDVISVIGLIIVSAIAFGAFGVQFLIEFLIQKFLKTDRK